ncbi:MAG: tetratricopeptide repeat protein [Candidatus Omnitrophica bacterium]|nr:tetratricopeptide repeat protein [Candidatus Omnitrophota bacterium]MDD5351891.1 tetratricopeptide repeat protein [Candidatus Omnitrophota bacterium]MDD5550717.1 tetratricopeptide repeat protein [Candidatus Omnitrophota bacterium]
MGKVIPKLHFIITAFIIFSFVPSSFSEIKKDRKEAQGYRDQGYEAQRSGNLDVALNLYQRAIETDPSYAMAYNDIGIVLEAKGMDQEAEEVYLKAISLDPDYLSSYYNLAALYEKEGKLEKADYYWKTRVNLGDWSDSWTWKAKEHLQQLKSSGKLAARTNPNVGNLDLKLTPNPKRDAQYHLYRGRQYLATEDYTSAFKELNAASVLDPGNPEIEQSIEDTQEKVLLYK